MFGLNRRDAPWHVSSPILARLIYGNSGSFLETFLETFQERLYRGMCNVYNGL